ncbi:MAG TPA: type II toxin-antitoxin system HicB family antitoxin [Mycobacteriales bacterium]|nr:type II toxin-antitoxin system HicB family antitoxin [Mycobacteriales bacterium]
MGIARAVHSQYRGRVAKVMISLPDELLSAVDERAERDGQTRSAFVQHALRVRLASADRSKGVAALDRVRRRMNAGDWRAVDVVRSERRR